MYDDRRLLELFAALAISVYVRLALAFRAGVSRSWRPESGVVAATIHGSSGSPTFGEAYVCVASSCASSYSSPAASSNAPATSASAALAGLTALPGRDAVPGPAPPVSRRRCACFPIELGGEGIPSDSKSIWRTYISGVSGPARTLSLAAPCEASRRDLPIDLGGEPSKEGVDIDGRAGRRTDLGGEGSCGVGWEERACDDATDFSDGACEPAEERRDGAALERGAESRAMHEADSGGTGDADTLAAGVRTAAGVEPMRARHEAERGGIGEAADTTGCAAGRAASSGSDGASSSTPWKAVVSAGAVAGRCTAVSRRCALSVTIGLPLMEGEVGREARLERSKVGRRLVGPLGRRRRRERLLRLFRGVRDVNRLRHGDHRLARLRDARALAVCHCAERRRLAATCWCALTIKSARKEAVGFWSSAGFLSRWGKRPVASRRERWASSGKGGGCKVSIARAGGG